jgi:hypothetical protein
MKVAITSTKRDLDSPKGSLLYSRHIPGAESFATANPSHCADIAVTFAGLLAPIFLPLVFMVEILFNVEPNLIVFYTFGHTTPPGYFDRQWPTYPTM